jgi:WD40 repeat protein
VRRVLLRCLLEGHTDAVLCIAADADGYIYTGSDDEKIRVWDTNDSWRCVQVGSHCALLCCSILAADRPIGVKSLSAVGQQSSLWQSNRQSASVNAKLRRDAFAFGSRVCDSQD